MELNKKTQNLRIPCPVDLIGQVGHVGGLAVLVSKLESRERVSGVEVVDQSGSADGS